MVLTTLTVAAVLLLLRLPTRSSPAWLPWLVVAWGGALPLELLLHLALPPPRLPTQDQLLYPDAALTGHERQQAQRCVTGQCWASDSGGGGHVVDILLQNAAESVV